MKQNLVSSGRFPSTTFECTAALQGHGEIALACQQQASSGKLSTLQAVQRN